MLKDEFEKRMGAKVTDDAYILADAAYLACGDNIDKDLFCELYKNAPMELVHLLANRVGGLEDELLRRDEVMTRSGEALLDVAEAVPGEEDQLNEISVSLMGKDSYLREKLKRGLRITRNDRKRIIDSLR